MTILPTSFDWIRQIKPSLKKLDSIPLTGSPPFPWEEFSSLLSKSFEREGIVIQPGELKWRSKENLYEGFGDAPFPLIFSIPSLQGQVCWVMPSQEISILAALLLTKDSHPIHDAALNESFYHFLALEVLYNLTQVSFDKAITPILTNLSALPDEDSLCWDISIQLNNNTFSGRLILSPEFRHSWVQHFAKKYDSSFINQQMAKLIEVIVHVEAGKIHLNLSEWNQVKQGDFIILDRCTLDPDNFRGRVMLSINGKKIFRAKLKEGTLKILELPLLQEVDIPMAKSEDEEEEEFEDLELPEEESPEEEFENEDFFEEEEELFSEEELEPEEELESEVVSEEEHPPSLKYKEEMKPTTVKEQKLIPSEEIPVNLTVEVGQIQMTMDQLLKLEPGNILEIDIHPENGVDLTINGKVVGKGELIRIGDSIGVRVLQLG